MKLPAEQDVATHLLSNSRCNWFAHFPVIGFTLSELEMYRPCSVKPHLSKTLVDAVCVGKKTTSLPANTLSTPYSSTLTVHFHCEDPFLVHGLGAVCGGKKCFVVGRRSLDLVETRDQHAYRHTQWARRNVTDLVQYIVHRVNRELLSILKELHAFPARHVC